MKNHFPLTVADILTRKHFENCHLAAGKNGLARNVKWVHVFEVTEVGDLLNGDELILSTGFGWVENEEILYSLLVELINCKAAGLCIELGKYVKGIPDKAKDLADYHSFPIMLFQTEVPFVEITQDIHSYLINQQYEMISNLERYSDSLNKKVLSINNEYEILLFLQRYLNLQVIYLTHNNEFQCIPEINENQKIGLLDKLNNYHAKDDPHVSSKKVPILENDYAEIFLVAKDRVLGEFESLILDRTATALAQHLLRVLYTEEKRKANETEWIQEWLQGVHSDEVVKEHLSYYKNTKNLNGAVVCIFKLSSDDVNNYITSDFTFLKIMIQTIFDEKNFFALTIEKRNHIICILINKENTEEWKSRVGDGVAKLLSNDFPNISKIDLAVGQYVNKLSDINNSYSAAKETLHLQGKMLVENRKYFYDDLHMYRLISLVDKHSDLNGFVNEYLEPLVNYDLKYNTNLMETLKVYLECNGSKKETATRIFVVRQTLYHRIEKLENILGDDFMTSEKRQVLEFCMLAREYLASVNQ
ncbi:PucR family transcriptional regulator [Salipaludibacillus sp. HK11]|uniref:PucR family transcriptional regulator n=1 Tax=Salipaludibacillus sp. HK11 TaxID=3394320 RepID=UPI0039FD0679